MVFLTIPVEQLAAALENYGFTGGEGIGVTFSATEPPNPQAGQLWLSSVNNELKIYNGVSWNLVTLSVTEQTQLASLGATITACQLAKTGAESARDIAVASKDTAVTKASEASTSASQALYYRNEGEVFRNEAEAFSLSKAFVVDTIEALSTIPSSYTTAIVKDLNRGGTFIWSATGTANGGTVFAGVSGYWNRQYSEAVNIKWFGAVGDGIADDTEAVTSARSYAYDNGIDIKIPKGDYLYSGAIYNIDSISTINKGLFTGTINILASAEKTNILVVTETEDTSPLDIKKSRVGISVTNVARGSHHSSGIRANLNNHSNDGNGNTAFYGRASSTSGTLWSAAVHGETRHGGGTSIALSSESACYNASGSMYGVVANLTTGGAEDTNPIDGASKATSLNAIGMAVVGNGDIYGDIGTWKTGLLIKSGSVRPSGLAINVETSALSAFTTSVSSVNSIADIYLRGNSANGIILAGNYTSGNAIRMEEGQAISFSNSGGSRLYYSDYWLNFNTGEVTKARISMSSYVSEFGHIRPLIDATYALGGAPFRWSTIFASTGTINTSDDRLKTYLTIEEKETLVAKELKTLMKKYKFNDSIKAKGDNARIHFGTSAQEVKATFEKHGLVAEDYALLCYDEWEEQQEVKDEEGTIIEPYRPSGNRYGIRYEELLCFIISAM